MTNRAATDAETLAHQYGDDRNLRARQRLWEISRSEPAFDFNRWSVDLLGAVAGDLVLDVGCGNGLPLAMLDEQGCTAVGVDLSPGMARIAPGACTAVADAQRLPFADEVFDAAAAFMMLYHVPDRAAAAAELRRVVRPGGVVVATTASADNQPELRALVEQAVGGGWMWTTPSTTNFNLEGGTTVLEAVFEQVECTRAPERRIFITDAEAMADYVASTADHHAPTLPPGRTWDDVVEAVRAATAHAVAADGALVVTARLGALVCR